MRYYDEPKNRPISAQDAYSAAIGVLKEVQMGRRAAEKLAREIARDVARIYPNRPKVEGDQILDRGTEKDPLYRLIASHCIDVPKARFEPLYSKQYFATLEIFDALSELYTSPVQVQGRYC